MRVGTRTASRLVGLAAAALAVPVAAAGLAFGEGPSERPRPEIAPAPTAAQLERGRELYEFNCTTCHGATGAGFAEARAAFPSDHYDCFRCHGPGNPPVMTPHQIETSQTAFSLGDPRPLNDPRTLARFGDAGALYAYVRATMPRWDPGRLEDEAFRDVVLYLLTFGYEVSPGAAELSVDELSSIRLDSVR